MKKLFSLIFIHAIIISFSQNAITGSGFTIGWPSSCTSNNPFSYFTASVNSTYSSGDLAPKGLGNQYWRMAVDWGGTIKQMNNTGSDQLVSSGIKYTLNSTCTTSGAMYANIASTSNRYVFKTLNAGSNPTGTWVFFELGGSSSSITNVTQSPISSSVSDVDNVLVSATLNSNFPTGQGAYLRYSIDNWATSSILSMSGSGTSYTATIPAQLVGTTVKYYVFTSGSGLTIAPSDADLYTINWNAGSVNGGSNYSYTVISSNTISTNAISGSPFCAGSSVSIPYTATGTYNAANNFTAQLSDAAGSFASPINIGNINSNSSGVISATIPSSNTYGTGYRIRVVSSNPAIVGTNNGSNLTINPVGFFANLETQSQSICVGNSISNGVITGRLYIPGITNSADQGSNITVEFGYNSANTNPNTWTNWSTATYKEDAGNDDRYTINNFGSLLLAGTYYYTFRYKVGNCNWVYGGYNTGNWNGTTNINGVLTVNNNTSITTQPSSAVQNVCINTPSSDLSVVAIGTSLSYQWYSNNSPSNSGGTLIPSAVSATFTPPTTVAVTKYYYVVVSGNCGSSVTSDVSGAIVVNSNSSAILSSAVGTNNQTLLNDSTPITSITYALSGISNATVTGLPTGITGLYSGNTFTISGAPTQVGVFNYSISFTANCGTVNNLTGTIKVNSYVVEYANIQFPKVKQTILLGDTFDIYAQVKITGITDSVGHGAGASGWLGYSTSNTNPSTWTNWTSINYNPNYETSGSYQISNDEYYYPDFVNSENLEGGLYYYASRFQRNGSSEYTYGGTDETSFNFSGGIWGTTSSHGPINVSGIIKVVDEVIWDGTHWKWYDDDDASWKTITEPNQRLKAKIEGNYPATAPSFTCKKLTIDNGVTLTIGSGKYVKVINEIVNNNLIADNVTVENDANLIQVNNTINTGSITVKRNANLKKSDYNYWGSPVANQILKTFSPNTAWNRYMEYHENDDYFYPVVSSNPFSLAKGYAIQADKNYTNTLQIFEGKFSGVPNNGVLSINLDCTGCSVNNNGYNLVANPYPSNIDFDLLHSQNSSLIYQTAYFWTNINPNPQMQGSNYPNGGYINNYAVYNGSGGVSATSPSPAPNDNKTPNNIIKVGQGFIVKAKNSGSLSFSNTIRNTNSGEFFNKTNTQKNTSDRFWVTLKTPLQVCNTILIAYKEAASNDFDLDYDAPVLIEGSDALFSILGDEKLIIQGKKYPLLDTDQIPIGANFYMDGVYQISIFNKEGIFANGKNIFLKDKLENKIVNLQEAAYVFTAKKGQVLDRFSIIYKTESQLGNTENSQKSLLFYRDTNGYTTSYSHNITQIKIYDASGRLLKIYEPERKTFRFITDDFLNGTYYVEIFTSIEKFHKKFIK